MLEFWAERDYVWVTHILSTEVCISTQEWQGVKMEWRHDRSGAGEERYFALCAICERNGMRPLRSPCGTV